MLVLADLQLHSRFSRAVSDKMTIPHIAQWARRKGIGVVATGDWTHPMWFREIQQYLEETGDGLLRLKPQAAGDLQDALVGSSFDSPRQSPIDSSPSSSGARVVTEIEKIRHPASTPLFLLATEVSCIYSQNGKGRRVHTLIWVPSLDVAAKINREMTKRGCNLLSDGRPIIGLTSIQVAELVFSIEPKALIIPAHAYTPWFSVYGSMSGFNSIDEAFGEYADRIYAVETGLSSNPAMNWRIKELDNRSIVSFSDAHSGPKLGREATVFEIPEGKLSYDAIYQAIKGVGAEVGTPLVLHRQSSTDLSQSSSGARAVTMLETTRLPAPSSLSSRIAYTIEFYPEEGKYHWSGHRACNIRWSPAETEKNGATCPVCGKTLIQGVEQRIGELAGRSEASLQLYKDGMMTKSKAFPNRPPFVMLVPLQEIISEVLGVGVSSSRVQGLYMRLTDEVGTEFTILLDSSLEVIARIGGNRLAEAIQRVREGNLHIDPGYDGVFGVVKIWEDGGLGIVEGGQEQLSLLTE